MLAVVVPAHDEEDSIEACLQSIAIASRCTALNGEAVRVVVALDACTDRTAALALAHGAATVQVAARNVGVARTAGVALALELGARWLAFTDADTTVAPDWLAAQLAERADAVCGTVGVVDWGEYGAALHAHFLRTYTDADGHRHIHGANLGVSAAAYRAVGGFEALACSEDVALVEALQRHGASIAWSAAPRVVTSARRSYRAPGGFGATLERVHLERARPRIGAGALFVSSAVPPGGADAVAATVVSRLRATLADIDPAAGATAALDRLVRLGLDRLPLPGGGQTLVRWQALAAVAEHDLSLAKLFEGHTDALAILAELGAADAAPPGSSWCVWAAEAPAGRALIESVSADGEAVLGGAKCWCSGAAGASHALLTAWHADGRGPQLVRIALRQPGVRVDAGSWRAVGMAGSASLDVGFARASARLVGGIGDYLSRPGFWQGGAGIAACWHGGALAVAAPLVRAAAEPAGRNPLRLAALGKVDLALESTAALLRDAAARIDADPGADACALALRVRLAAEDAAGRVLDEVGRALGATPFCRDERFARAAADLPVFVRQSHADRDFAALGERSIAEAASRAPPNAPGAVHAFAAGGATAALSPWRL